MDIPPPRIIASGSKIPIITAINLAILSSYKLNSKLALGSPSKSSCTISSEEKFVFEYFDETPKIELSCCNV